MAAREATATEWERRNAELVRIDGQMRAEPNTRVSLTVEQPAQGRWVADDVVDLAFVVRAQNLWVYPLTLTQLEGRVYFEQGRSQELTPYVKPTPVGPVSVNTVRREFRWQPRIDPADGQLDPERESLMRLALGLRATFRGEYGEFALGEWQQQVWVRVMLRNAPEDRL